MNKLANKLSLLCALILLFNQYVCAQVPSNSKEITDSPFVLNITYKNYGKKSKHLVKVGIKVSNVSEGPATCAGMSLFTFRFPVSTYFSDTLQLQANYAINFHVSNSETIIDAIPPIAIKPGEAEYFTISFLPSIIGSCSELISFEVSGILIFDNNEKVYVTPKQNRITGEEVNKFITRTPDEAELLSSINHRNIEIRRQAFSQLSKSTLNSEELKFLIDRGLNDEDLGVRAAAAISASKLRYKISTKTIGSLLKSSLSDLDTRVKLKQVKPEEKGKTTGLSGLVLQPPSRRVPPASSIQIPDFLLEIDPNGELLAYRREVAESLAYQREIADYCVALGELQDADGVDVLISTLTNLNFEYPEKASDALIKLNHPDVINKVRPLLLKNIEWSSGKNFYLKERYSEIYRIIIAYRDVKSVETLLALTDKSNDLLSSIISEIDQKSVKTRIIRDPFILAMRPAFEKALKHSDYSYTRISALNILSLMPLSDNTIQDYFRTVFKDKDFNNRLNAADLAADLGYKSLADEIISLMKLSKSNSEKERYCKALEKLGVLCKE